MKKLLAKLGVRSVGFFELLVALSPMLSGFTLFEIPVGLLISIVIFLICLFRGYINTSNLLQFRPLLFLFLYILFHDLVLVIVAGKNIYGYIATLLGLINILCLTSSLNIEKLKGSINLVAIIAMIGLVFQYFDLIQNGGVHPIQIPGLGMSEERLSVLVPRPSSFFMEPAAYAEYMLIPISYALIDRRFVWCAIMIFSVFFTTSTTGLLGCFILLGFFLITQKQKVWSLIAIIILGLAMFFSLQKMTIFEFGVDKLVNRVDVEEDVRIAQGPYLVSTMRFSEIPFGIPYASPYSYGINGRAPSVGYNNDNSVYMSSFWYMILCYGVIGLALYLYVYFYLFRKYRELRHLYAVLIALLFTAAYNIGGDFCFAMFFVLTSYYNKLTQLTQGPQELKNYS